MNSKGRKKNERAGRTQGGGPEDPVPPPNTTAEPMDTDPPPPPREMTIEEAMEHYSKTVQDVHRKRVNKMNAFNYRMTDYLMKVFTTFNESREQENVKWEKYGEGIDVCAEVYGYCVDFVHMSTNRLMNGLHRVNGEPEQEEPEQENEEQDQEERPKPKKKKLLQEGLTTLEAPEALQSKNIDRGYEMDPFYAKMSSCFDAGSSKGILLNNLKVNEGLELLLYSKETMECPFNQEFGVFNQPCFPDLTIEILEGEKLCKEMEEFEARFITGVQPRPPTFQRVLESITSQFDDPADIPDPAEEAEAYRETFENTIPDMDAQGGDTHFERRSLTLEESLNRLTKQSDFHFFTAKPGTWAGFEYWNKRVVSITAKKSEKKPRRKEPAAFDFDPEQIRDRKDLFQNEAKDQYHKPKYFNDLNPAEFMLPADYQVSLRRFTQTFSKPNTQVKLFRRVDEAEAAEENVVVQNYNEQGADSPAAEEGNELYAREEEMKELPPATQRQEDQLQFSKVSKRVDIKLLKDEIWRQLGALGGRSALGPENRGQKSREQSFSKMDPSMEAPTFMQVVRGLPERLPQQELENLSIHSCFITMLHLANEKSKSHSDLSLEAVGECDFRIATRLS